MTVADLIAVLQQAETPTAEVQVRFPEWGGAVVDFTITDVNEVRGVVVLEIQVQEPR